MNTVRDDIAQVRESLNVMGVDVRMPNQYIYSRLFDVASTIIKRELDTRRIFKSTEVFPPLCVPMKRVPSTSCTNLVIPGCSEFSRSVDKIPRTYQTPTGSVIIAYTIDRSKQIFQSNPVSFINIAKREYKSNSLYYWIENDYLYMPHNVDAVLLSGLFVDTSEVEKWNNGGKGCYNFLDSQSSLPEWLRMDTIRVVVQEIGGTRMRINADEKPDENSNSRN